MSQVLTPYIIYLHGFKSSPASYKAQYLSNYLQQRGWQEQYVVPELDYRPERTMAQLRKIIEQGIANFNITLIGSSLGGYYATFLTERYGVNSVLLNPAVAPFRMLADNLGIHTNYHTGQQYDITQQEVDQLRQLEIPELKQAEKYLVLLQSGDDTLDYREAADKYAACKLVIQEGGSHGFDNFEQVVPDLLSFAGMEINSNKRH